MIKQDNYYETEKYNPSDFPFVAVAIGHNDAQNSVERKSGWELNQFLWITEGKGMFKTCGKTIYLSKGHGFFTRKCIPHSYVPLGDTFSTSWVTFLSGDNLLNYYNIPDWLVFDVPGFLEKSRQQLCSLCYTAKTLPSRTALAYTWATELLDALSAHELSNVEKIQQFLEQNCSEPITLEQISEKIGMSKFNLCKYYHRETGETIMDTLKSIRMQRAKKMLHYGFDSISEIGRQCGYEDLSYFIKIFREEVGTTPLKYRQNRK